MSPTPDSAVVGLPQQRLVRTEIPGPRSRELAARKATAVAGGVGTTMPVYAARAGDGVVVDVDGNSLIDLGSGIAVTSVGASAATVAAAVAQQASAFTHTCFMVTPYEGYVAVAERLNELTPGDHPKRTALFTSGAEAVENAVKIARVATGRDAIVVFDHAYHGRTTLTMTMTAKARPYKDGFGPFAPEVYRTSGSYPYRDGLTGPDALARALERIEVQVGSDRVAAVVIEPIQGEGGFVVPAPGFLPGLAQWCQQHGIVLVADEIQTGMARTGAMFACEHEGVVPDLVTTAKGIAGGLPLSGVTGRAELIDAVPPGGLGGTYGGNPIACAAALATLDLYREQDLTGAARRIEQTALPLLLAAQRADPRIGDVRGRGAMLALELVAPDSGAPDPQLAQRVARAAHAAGVVVLTCGTWGNVIRLLPPLTMPLPLLAEGIEVLLDGLAETVAGT